MFDGKLDEKIALTDEEKEGVRKIVLRLKEISDTPILSGSGKMENFERFFNKSMGLVANYIEEIAL